MKLLVHFCCVLLREIIVFLLPFDVGLLYFIIAIFYDGLQLGLQPDGGLLLHGYDPSLLPFLSFLLLEHQECVPGILNIFFVPILQILNDLVHFSILLQEYLALLVEFGLLLQQDIDLLQVLIYLLLEADLDSFKLLLIVFIQLICGFLKFLCFLKLLQVQCFCLLCYFQQLVLALINLFFVLVNFGPHFFQLLLVFIPQHLQLCKFVVAGLVLLFVECLQL